MKQKQIVCGPNWRAAGVIAIVAFGFGCWAVPGSAHADHVNVTGQSQKMQGGGSPAPGNPAEGKKPLLPGDQPAKEGTHQGSQVRNTDPQNMMDKKQGQSQ